jgi:hypothetical protein
MGSKGRNYVQMIGCQFKKTLRKKDARFPLCHQINPGKRTADILIIPVGIMMGLPNIQ